MLELFKRNGDVTGGGVLINVLGQDDAESKYGCHLILLTGIDREVGNIITFAAGLISHMSKTSAWWVINTFIERGNLVKK